MLYSISHYKDSGIAREIRTKNAEALTKLLASHFLLFTKTLQAHWNVRGKFFGPLHSLFQEGYTLLYESIDEIAERISQLGFICPGTTTEFRNASIIKEEEKTVPMSDTEMLQGLTNDLIVIINESRKVIAMTSETDAGTNNKITDLLENTEKYLWKVQSHLL